MSRRDFLRRIIVLVALAFAVPSVLFSERYWRRWRGLVGYRGRVFTESGYVYAPYMPLQITPLVPQHPLRLQPRKLRAQWTIEPAEDLSVMYGAELEHALIEELRPRRWGFIRRYRDSRIAFTDWKLRQRV